MDFPRELCAPCGKDFGFAFRSPSRNPGWDSLRGRCNLNPLPAGVRAIAALFALCGVYLSILALVMLARPGLISMSTGAPLLFGLELAGPYMFLLAALAAGVIAWGLARLNNILRHAAILAAIAGIVMLVPSVSGAVVMAQLKPLALGGLGIIIRVIVAWYLSQRHIADHFKSTKVGV